ncbi:Ubiquinone hydroxylase UbiL [Rhodovastum atsumiense]|uniref:UbiH/UbiF/VisC/COQ6 family ubiquinone biosynthesis hydroxylase n=1 Tax=Rhodovastum atsumiense TaxID=504468 RepID=A0A5M6IKK3_9PROT|nr:UbiH/UbiF/VisC/COQ6 family ubiquinone biosynthesis hydroxylase [Rhodovastum atsumiense]KAA5608791.1 UbiH/UbiF/VisC/COQ6 family ubiquinone biosynthesis hydroxylase [Rhodovastum atsumiense]CAH2600878.1 Ubiquinone hydroxylase UbiL [Rhodovastum atsumiense]
MAETIDVDVCIIGAGPVGGTLACRLGAAGIPTAIVDRAPLPPMEHPDFDGRAYAIAAGPRRVLEDAGLWDRLPFRPGAITDIRVTDGRIGRPASPLFLHFDSRDVITAPDAEAVGGAFGWMVEARSLRMAINARLAALPDVQVFAPAVATVERQPRTAIVRLAGGPTVTCRLVVAAEGRNSPLRRQAGILVTHLPYRQTGIVFAIAHERPHFGCALEHFLPAGPFAQLPMAPTDLAPNVSAIVWTERDDIARRMLALDDATFTREAARRLGDHLGAIRLLGRRWSYPLSAMLAHRYIDTRLALVGDAAHGVHPIAGQGLNLGFRDVAALAELVIAAIESHEDPGALPLLQRYQAERRPDNMMMLAATDILDRLFSNDVLPLRLARDVGIAAVHRIPPLKRLFMQQAMGALMA